jgi:hypothetical protein
MKKFIFYFLKITLAGIILASLIAEGSYWALRNGNFYKPTFVENSIKEKNLDYVVLGASTALTGIDTRLLDSITGMKGYNLAIDDTGMPNSYIMLKHYLAQRKTTKKVILVPTVSSLKEENSTLGDNDHRFLMYNKRAYVHHYYKELEQEEEKFPVMSTSKYLPFLGISYYNVELFFPSLVSLVKPDRRNRFDEFGNYTYPDKKFKPKKTDLKIEKVDFNNDYFKKIVQLCEKENIQLSVYFPPIYNTRLTIENKGYSVINFTEKLKEPKNFYDVLHINRVGRNKVTVALAQKLMDE